MSLVRILCVSGAVALAGPALASPEAMTPDEARHLLSRTGFGAAPHEIAAFTGLSYAEGVAVILGGVQTQPTVPMPVWVDAWDYPQAEIWALGQTATDLFYTNRYAEIEELSAWWLAEMAITPSPLTERMTLFWHDHFATSFEEAENPQWMARQNRFFRANAVGNFGTLARGILRDPAMLSYLSNDANVADAPNENLGREFLELFTLGEGRGYTEADVIAAARALSGHGLAENQAPVYQFWPEDHDAGVKTILGQTGPWSAEDLADIALASPGFGPYIVEKLWLEFVSDQPDPDEVARLAALWRAHDLDMAVLLEALFLSDAFWAEENRGRLVKSPAVLLVGTLRSLGLSFPDGRELAWIASEMGQDLFFPPNVAGWPGGIAWINDASAASRSAALTYLMSRPEGEDRDPAAMMGLLQPAPLGAAPEAFRVGEVFALHAEAEEGVVGGFFTLFDVGVFGRDVRSISLWIELDTRDDSSGMAVYLGDCPAVCLPSVPREDDPHWVWFEPWPGMADDLPQVSAKDFALIRALTGHLPALIESTEGQRLWLPDPEDGRPPVPLAFLVTAAQHLADGTGTALGPSDAALVRAFSRPGVRGLDGLGAGANMDAYLEAREARLTPAITPAVTYDSAADWLAALPGQGLQSARAEAALLAIAIPGLRQEKVASDPAALLRRLILAPEFQLN